MCPTNVLEYKSIQSQNAQNLHRLNQKYQKPGTHNVDISGYLLSNPFVKRQRSGQQEVAASKVFQGITR